MPTDRPRVMVTLDEEAFAFVEEFRYRNHYPNRSMALNALIEAGLKALAEENDTSFKKPTRSKKK